MAEVALINLGRVFRGGTAALHDLSLHVRDGELLAVVGPSGSGKTTMLQLIAGLDEPTTGEVRIGGRSVNGMAPHERNVAMVFQGSSLYPHMTIRRNLAFGLRGAREEVTRRVEAASAALRIERFLGRYPDELSGGERQRAALAKAMARRPGVFLFDEPLSNLDARLRQAARLEIRQLQKHTGITTIHVTHDQEEAMMLGDRIAVLNRGVLQQVGVPREVYSAPANAFVGGFIGSPAMNIVPGRLEVQNGRGTFVEDVHGAQMGERLRVPLVPRQTDVPAEWNGRTVQAGIRPQALRMDGEKGVPVNLAVRMIEPLGDVTDLQCEMESGRSIVVRTGSANGMRADQRVRMWVKPEDVYIFEPGECGRRVSALD